MAITVLSLAFTLLSKLLNKKGVFSNKFRYWSSGRVIQNAIVYMYTLKKKELYRTPQKGSVDVKKLANVLKVPKKE
jgi:hypothetical protein